MKTFCIKPATAGLKVRDPITFQHLNADGETKERSNYWLRRVASGEVVIVQKPAAAAVAPKTGK